MAITVRLDVALNITRMTLDTELTDKFPLRQLIN
jgi:hypothetical protein